MATAANAAVTSLAGSTIAKDAMTSCAAGVQNAGSRVTWRLGGRGREDGERDGQRGEQLERRRSEANDDKALVSNMKAKNPVRRNEVVV